MTTWGAWLQGNQTTSVQWLAAKLKGLDNPWTQQEVTRNQVTSVRALCANRSSRQVLLIVWLVFGACCLAIVGSYLVIKSCSRNKQSGLISRILSLASKSIANWSVAVVYPALKGIVGLAFYYYDLITSIVVLVQLWDKWPGHVLAAIFFLHFATTGMIIAIRVASRCHAKWHNMPQQKLHGMSVTVLTCLVCSPVTIPVVVLLDTIALASHIWKCIKAVGKPLYACCQCMHTCRAVQCLPAGAIGSLSWIDLDNCETMHNLIAAGLQSLPTAVLNSVLYSLGNKPSHGIFLSDTLFVASVVASCLAMLKSLALIFWEAHTRSVNVTSHVRSVVTGQTLW